MHCLDNLITGRYRNLEQLLPSPDFQFTQADVTCLPAGLEPAEAVFHLASPASPPGYFQYPEETALTNSKGTHALLGLATGWQASFLFASTSEVYGDPLVHPQPETYWGNVNTVGMRSCYDESKRFGETLTYTFIHKYGTRARIVRIFNTYGPFSDPNDGRIVPNFITQALRGEPITVYGDGRQTRSLCYVSDLVDGLLRAMFHPGSEHGVFNLGNPEEHTVLEYAHLIREMTGSTSEIVHVPPISKDEPQLRRPDISRARQLLGWQPQVGLRDGLTRTVAWFRQELAR